MKKTLLITATATLTLGISSVASAGEIEIAQRYSAPLEQNVVEMDVTTVETEQDIVAKELGTDWAFGSNAEIAELGGWGRCIIRYRRPRRSRYRRWR